LYLAILRWPPQFLLYDISMEEDRIQGIADVMHHLGRYVTEQGTALGMPGRFTEPLPQELCALGQRFIDALTHGWGEFQVAKALPQG
jgi:hypothetical protein